jgi:hypothetical protein
MFSLETYISMISGPSRSTFSDNYAGTSVVPKTLIDVVLHLNGATADDFTELTSSISNIYI